jgi:hypothetical protein
MSTYYDGLTSKSAVTQNLDGGEAPEAIVASELACRYFQMRKMCEIRRLGEFQPTQQLVKVGCATGLYTI